MFEQTFKNVDDVLWKEAGCSSELDVRRGIPFREESPASRGEQRVNLDSGGCF